LKRLLDALAANANDEIVQEVIVVDNDPSGSAAQVARDRPGVRYVIEALPGVSNARNRAIAEASGDVLMMLDDDQGLPPDFLARAWGTWLRRPHGFCGLRIRVQPEFVAEVRVTAIHEALFTPPWVYDYQPVTRAEFGTGGLIVDSVALASLGDAPFDVRFGSTGGEDTDLFLRLAETGYEFGHLSYTHVLEAITPERASLRYMLRRQYLSGRLDAGLDDTVAGRATAQWTGSERAFRWAWQLATSPVALARFRKPRVQIDRLMLLAHGAGRLAAAVEARFRAPAGPDGAPDTDRRWK
jgi:succinoglycan biosynthesis protein ExoM